MFSAMTSIVSIPATKASIFDWTSIPYIPDISTSSQTFAFPNLNPNYQSSDDNNGAAAGALLVQNDSLVSSGSSVNPKKTSNTENDSKVVEIMVFATAYSSTPDQTDGSPFVTASGTRVRDGIIATNFLPLGTKIKIPEIYGDKVFVVEDRMNRRYWQKIDIWFPTRSGALDFGIQKVKIQLVES